MPMNSRSISWCHQQITRPPCRLPALLSSSFVWIQRSSRGPWKVGWNTWSRDRPPTFSRSRRCWRSWLGCSAPSVSAPPSHNGHAWRQERGGVRGARSAVLLAAICDAKEEWMEHTNASEGSLAARWRTLPREHQLHGLLRLGVVGCFLGHGAYGVLTKEAWVPYFAVVGIDRTWAYRLMPWIGMMDLGLGLTMAVVPLPMVLLHLTVWGLWTAALRPLAGEAVWECVERAGNYGVPLAILVLVGVPRGLRGWFTPVWPSDTSPLTVDRARVMHGILRVTTFFLLLGHGALGDLDNKPELAGQYDSTG